MPVVSFIKKSCWVSVAVAIILFVGLISIIVVKTNRNGSKCEGVRNASKFDILKCKGELAYDSSKETLENLFDFYDENTNITGTQQSHPAPSPNNENHRKKRDIGTTSFKLVEYEPFLKCLTDVNCGIISKCMYDIEYASQTDGMLKNNSKIDVIYGSLYVIKNYVPYAVDYYWMIIGNNAEIYEKYGNKTLHKVRMQPNSALYIDSRLISKHHIKVYFDERQEIITDGEHYKTNVHELPNIVDNGFLSGLSTINSPGIECQKYQACKYLTGVCFANDLNGDRCYEYQDACRFFYDADRSVKDYELIDYFYTYYPSCVPPNATINPEEISDWVCKGGGISGSSVGHINSTPVVVLSLLLFASITVHVAAVYAYYNFKKKIINYDPSFNDTTNEDLF
jgi:hypothetical protein